MRKLIFSILTIIALIGCNDEDYLSKDPHSLTDKAFYTSVNGATQGLNAAYDILQLGEEVERVEFSGTVCSGDAMTGGEPGGNDQPSLQFMARFNILPNSLYVTNYWDALYRGIYRCNLILNYLSLPTEELEQGFPEVLKNRLIGEATFLRGLYHFKLQIHYGGYSQSINDEFFEGQMLGVPFVDKILPPDQWQQTRPTLEYTWDKIEEDFRNAAVNLPERSDYAPADMGRATRGAALAMLAKSHLYQEEWQEAYDAASEVINSGEYYLIGDDQHPGPFTVTRLTKDGEIPVQMQAYKWLFQPEANNCPEAIFEVQHFSQHSTSFPQGQEGNLVPRYYGPREVVAFDVATGAFGDVGYFWGFILPTKYFVNTAYEDIGCEDVDGTILDPRYRFTVVEPTDSFPFYYADAALREQYSDSAAYSPWFNWPCTGYCTWKYFTDPIFTVSASTLGDYPQNTKYLRYADLLLIGAEAAAHIGQNADALAWINKVRERARNSGNTTYPLALSGTITPEQVWAERRVELAFEGHQFFDVVRTGRAEQVLKIDAYEGDFESTINPLTSAEGDQQFGSAFQVGKHEIWPIPEREMDNSEGSITQNPNYE